LPGAWWEFWTRILGSTVGLTLKPRIPGSVRYGVYKIYQARVLGETDSEKQPGSEADGAFVMIYRRDPGLKFCARRYRFESEPFGSTQDHLH